MPSRCQTFLEPRHPLRQLSSSTMPSILMSVSSKSNKMTWRSATVMSTLKRPSETCAVKPKTKGSLRKWSFKATTFKINRSRKCKNRLPSKSKQQKRNLKSAMVSTLTSKKQNVTCAVRPSENENLKKQLFKMCQTI